MLKEGDELNVCVLSSLGFVTNAKREKRIEMCLKE